MDRARAFPHFPALATRRLVLREITATDCDWYLAHFSLPEIVHGQGFAAPADRRAAEGELREYVLDLFADRGGFRWGIALQHDPALIGSIGLYAWVDEPLAQAELGYDLAPPFWGRGLMSEALDTVLDFAFGPMGLQRVEAKVLTDNARSMRLLERAGFHREARLFESGEDEHGQRVDEFLFGMDRVRPDS